MKRKKATLPSGLPLFIPKGKWWTCTCHNQLQKHFYPMIIGENKLCVDGSATFLWDGKIPKAK